MTKPTPLEALTSAVGVAGSQAELARICEVSATAVWKWVQSSKRMPAEYVLRAEAATGVSRHDLRPDIYPREIMVDHHAGARFEGVDQHAFSPVAPARLSSRAHATRDFNRDCVLKGADQ
ncbi:transcriptional regulator [Qipengyuania citrea]|uniref:transcriptional regulator n=1 Tax=Qipengyuania citrea TaxID=225971 RepID=UPI0020A1C748|nr:YdaS family helix-turn-helix protein [Qipengyuania citrea]MCP2016860.1 DNA-binding transcriptional regulator YdaS (Cro superfamily) [Qipengyuania citrea]